MYYKYVYKVFLLSHKDYLGHVTTAVDIEKIYTKDENNQDQLKSIQISVHYDGWTSKWDETVCVDPTKILHRRWQKLYSVTPYHAYLDDDALPPCKWQRGNKVITCEHCGKKTCVKCSVAEHSKCCIDCVDRRDYDGILQAVSDTILDQYPIDPHILKTIADYAMGVAVQCSNTIKKCDNEIYFKSTYRLDLNYRHQRDRTVKCYQYHPKYLKEGTHELYGKMRRIFCGDCTKNELAWCKDCGSVREVKPLNYDANASRTSPCAVICHNHTYAKCTLCDEEFDESSGELVECQYCNKMHCTICESEYIRCPERMQSENEKEFNQIRNAVSKVKDFAIDCENVINAIAEYSMGVAMTCSNTNNECQHEICYDSMYEFDLNVSKCRDKVKNVKMYQYSPKFVHDDGTHLIYGKQWRTFCEQCTANELVACISCRKYKEIKPMNYDANAPLTSAKSVKCHNHKYVECVLCDKQYDLSNNEMSSCLYCNKIHCGTCQKELKTALVPKCPSYAQKKEIEEIFGALKTVLNADYNFSENDEKVIHVLAEYSLGAVVVCSNAIKKCQTEINFDFKGQIILNLRQSIKNPKNVSIYQYCPKYITNGTIQICGKMRRIFCAGCTQNELVDCRCCDLGKEPKPKNYDPNAPGQSSKASKCYNHKFIPCSICGLEYENSGAIKVEWCVNCRLMHCSKCEELKKCVEIQYID